jgi:hypothetical protein
MALPDRLTFFIAGLLYLLCFEHLDNLGAYSASRLENGLLIPSVFVGYSLPILTSKIIGNSEQFSTVTIFVVSLRRRA